MSRTIVKNKKSAMSDFFTCYAGNISGELYDMDREQLLSYLEDDIFISVASAASGIEVEDFRQFAPEFFGV